MSHERTRGCINVLRYGVVYIGVLVEPNSLLASNGNFVPGE